jgi:hypothetical protein
LALPQAASQRRSISFSNEPSEILARVLHIIQYYEDEIGKAGTRTAKDGMGIVAREIERDGLYGVKDFQLSDESM